MHGGMSNMIEHPEGVWLNLSEESYFSDPALGSTALKTLLTSPCDYWWSSGYNNLVANKEFSEEETRAQRLGSAVHCALLEGVEVFQSVYGICPDKYTHPHALDTAEKLKARLKELGEKISGSKDELIQRLKAADPNAVILDDIIEAWKADGKKPLSKWDYSRVMLMERVLLGRKDQPTELGKAFIGGLSELSVVWLDEWGIRHRARFDKIKPNVTIDLKTFSNWQGRELTKAMLREAALRYYHLQASHYLEARRQLRRLVAEGKIFAPTSEDPVLKAKIEADIALLHEIAKADKARWVWVFFKTDGAPIAKGLIMDWEKTHQNVMMLADGLRNEAIGNFLRYREAYGLSHDGPMWRDSEQLITVEGDQWPYWASAPE